MVELSRPVSVERLPATLMVEADVEERDALATRLRIVAVLALRCRFTLKRFGSTVVAHGVLQARVVQSCVVSLEPVEQAVAETFELRFVPAGRESTDDDMDPETPDELPYDGTRIDLGEAAAEQLALALDPYPRHPDAALGAGDNEPPLDGPGESGTGVFGGLAALRRPQ